MEKLEPGDGGSCRFKPARWPQRRRAAFHPCERVSLAHSAGVPRDFNTPQEVIVPRRSERHSLILPPAHRSTETWVKRLQHLCLCLFLA